MCINHTEECNPYYLESGYNVPDMSKFKPRQDSEFDRAIYERTFSGRLTKKRYKAISRWCRIASMRPYYRCGHDYDCCGCMCGQYAEFDYNRNQVTVTLVQSFNY
jgi:hypothetical protein